MQSSQNPYPVQPTGFLIGSFLACGLYGAHTSQIYVYFSTFNDGWKLKLLVLWIYTLSSLQILIIVGSAWKYYIGGIRDPNIWGEFWWALSVQDGLIPSMAFTAQLFFGYRAWRLNGRRKWMGIIFTVMPIITMTFGIALAVTARIWSDDPWVSAYDFGQRQIGVPSQIVAITWMGLSALTDGALTTALIYRFIKARSSVFEAARSLAWRLIALTLETVLLTHIVGAAMCIIFLASPAAHRTNQDIFWVLLEIITELYALSMLFTINARATFLREYRRESDVPAPPIPMHERKATPLPANQTALDKEVEGYQHGPGTSTTSSRVGVDRLSTIPASSLGSSDLNTPHDVPVLYIDDRGQSGFLSLSSGDASGQSSGEPSKPPWP